MTYPVLRSKDELLEFMKRRRKWQMVIFDGDLLPIKCVRCPDMIVDDANRVRVYPKEKLIVPMHYECAWDSLFEDIMKLGVAMGKL